MGLLFFMILGIGAIIGIARLASKMKRDEAITPRSAEPHLEYTSSGCSKSQSVDEMLQKGLISLLLKKKIIGEEELLEEINRIKNNPDR